MNIFGFLFVVYFFKLSYGPSINHQVEQVESSKLILFQNGVMGKFMSFYL